MRAATILAITTVMFVPHAVFSGDVRLSVCRKLIRVGGRWTPISARMWTNPSSSYRPRPIPTLRATAPLNGSSRPQSSGP